MRVDKCFLKTMHFIVKEVVYMELENYRKKIQR